MARVQRRLRLVVSNGVYRMRTPDLIRRLAADLKPVPRRQVEKIVCGMMGVALVGTVAMAAALLGVRPDLPQAAAGGAFWSKIAFTVAIAGAAGALTCRLARPAGRTSGLWPLLIAPILVAVTWSAAVLTYAPAEDRSMLWLGHTWIECPLVIVALALPSLASLIVVLRRLAPTRLTLAGTVAGVAAGAIAATGYALHCPENSVPFLTAWYGLGIAATAALGALLAPRFLRW